MSYSNQNIRTLDDIELITGVTPTILLELSNDINKHVRVYLKPKGSGIGFREICVPTKKLKNVQQLLNEKLFNSIPLPPNLQGGVPGKSPKSNANIHLHKPVVITLDIKDFYPNIRYTRVFDLFIELGFSPDISQVLTRITTYNYHLAQGFPTSSTIANLILAKILPRVLRLTHQYRITFTTYQDNLYFSGNTRVLKFSNLFSKIFRQEGFKTHMKKIMQNKDQQIVSGYVVNKKINISRQEYRNLRSILHQCKTQGILSVADRPIEKFILHLEGRIQRIMEVNSKRGQKLIEELCSIKLQV